MSLKWKLAQAIEVKWWNHYLRNKDKSTYYSWKKSYWLGFLETIGYKLPDHPIKIMDAGSGPAGIFTILDRYEVVAVDPLLEKYKTQLGLFDPADYPYARFVTSTIESIQMDQQFDTIFCLNCINHVNSIQSSLRNLFNALKPGGKLILSTDAHNSNLLKSIFQIIPGDVLHPHQYNIEAYQQFVNNAGFQINKTMKIKSEIIFGYWVIKAYRPH